MKDCSAVSQREQATFVLDQNALFRFV
jgi:hypothetical protein